MQREKNNLKQCSGTCVYIYLNGCWKPIDGKIVLGICNKKDVGTIHHMLGNRASWSIARPSVVETPSYVRFSQQCRLKRRLVVVHDQLLVQIWCRLQSDHREEIHDFDEVNFALISSMKVRCYRNLLAMHILQS